MDDYFFKMPKRVANIWIRVSRIFNALKVKHILNQKGQKIVFRFLGLSRGLVAFTNIHKCPLYLPSHCFNAQVDKYVHFYYQYVSYFSESRAISTQLLECFLRHSTSYRNSIYLAIYAKAVILHILTSSRHVPYYGTTCSYTLNTDLIHVAHEVSVPGIWLWLNTNTP